MLRTMKGYDEYNTILLPPRQPGEKLPLEVIDSYSEQQRKKEADEKAKADAAGSMAEGAEEGLSQSIPTIATPSAGQANEKAASVDGDAKDGK